MNRPFRSFSTAAALLAAALLAGCAAAPDVRYGDPGAHQSLSTDFGASDLQQVAEGMVDSLLTFPAVVDITAQRRPILSVTRVKNKTLQHIDTESITDSIRARLIKSGRFRFIDRTTDQEALEEFAAQQEGGLVDPAKAVPGGLQAGAEYLLTANLSEIRQQGGRVTDVYYKFTMNLKNLKTGILEWSDEKEIRKIKTKGLIGG
jgi:uncharacterized protein (TIGR02722 family)